MERILVIILFLCSSIFSSAQETGRYYLLQPNGSDFHEETFSLLAETGYRLWVYDDSVRLYISDPGNFAQAMRQPRGNIVLVHKQGQFKIRAGQLRRTLRDSYMESFHWKSPRYLRGRQRYFNRLWRGKEKDLNTKRALFIPLPVNDQSLLDWHISFRKGKKNIASLTFHEEIVRRIDYTPFVPSQKCLDANRWTYFREGNIGGPRFIQPLPDYEPETVRSSRKIFSLTFQPNQVEADPYELDNIRHYLENEPRPIDRIYIHGFASVEGDSLQNQRLTEQRAEVLVRTLHRQGREDIRYHVRTQENWRMFESQVRREGWPEQSREAWKQGLENDSVRQAMEPWLARQRSARLMIYLKDSVPQEDQQQTILRNFKKIHHAYERRPDRARLAQLLAIRRYVRDQVQQGGLPEKLLFNLSGEPSEYDLYVLFEESTRSDTIPVYFHFLLQSAYHTALARYRENVRREDHKADLLYVQQQALKAMENDPLLSADRFPVPEGAAFLQLQLNYMAFVERRSGLQRNVGSAGSMKWSISPSVRETRYYYLLKQVAQETLTRGLKAVAYRSDWTKEFDLAEFLNMTLRGWDPFSNTFLDEEIGRKEIGRLISLLKNEQEHLCEDDVTYLRLTYALKLIQAGSVRPIRDPQMHNAIKFLIDYYSQVGPNLPETQRIDLANQLTAANSYLYYNEAIILSEWLRGTDGCCLVGRR